VVKEKKKRLPDGVTTEELDLIVKSIWRNMGDGLKPWGKKWTREKERELPEEGLNVEDTL